MQRVKKKASTVCFFFRFSSKSRLVNVVVDVRFAILLQPTFVFAQRLFFCYQKREVYLCWQNFFFLGFGNKGFGQTNKKHFFSLKQTFVGIRKKKRAKNTSFASHHVAQLFHDSLLGRKNPLLSSSMKMKYAIFIYFNNSFDRCETKETPVCLKELKLSSFVNFQTHQNLIGNMMKFYFWTKQAP